MKDLQIALLQLTPAASCEENRIKGIRACQQARQRGADIALFPEMWNNGYRLYDQPIDVWQSQAIAADNSFVQTFGDLARDLQMAIGITFLEKKEAGFRNTMILFDRWGRRVLTYAKVHTCDFDVERHLTRGDDFPVCVLDTACGEVNVGAMICYDREFPESARILMLEGAELILVPNACPMEINRLSQLRARAYENMLAVATCNYPHPVPDCNGHSSVFDGIAYPPHATASRDTCILLAPETEGIFLAALDLAQLRIYRQTETQGNTYRHPRQYRLLTRERIEDPFIRPDYRP